VHDDVRHVGLAAQVGQDPVNDRTARRMWQLYEPIHDVTYFTPEASSARGCGDRQRNLAGVESGGADRESLRLID
jgi:hypothetical protein